MPTALFNANRVASCLGVSRAWVHKHRQNSPELEAEFYMDSGPGGLPTLLWTQAGIDRWRDYVARLDSSGNRFAAYSTHKAVNILGSRPVTWKLWWQTVYDGRTRWWFSTPRGWFCSDDDGRTWRNAHTMTLEGGHKYFCVNPAEVGVKSCVSAVLRSAANIRREIENAIAMEGRKNEIAG